MTISRSNNAASNHFAKIQKRKAEEAERARALAAAESLTIGDIAFQKGRLLGVGTFGRVYEAIDLTSGSIIAVKQIELKSKKAEETAQATKHEIKLMEQLKHPNIVALLGHSIEPNCLNVMMEFVAGNSLDSIVQSSGPLHEGLIRKYVKQMLHALEYCHSKGVLHRDIKGKNILLDSSGMIKMADFGSAKIVDNVATKDDPSVNYAYTPLWCAPEVMTGKYNSKVDIWSLGCVVIELATGKEPLAEKNFESSFAALYFIASTATAMPYIPSSLSKQGHDFIKLCLTRNVDARPTAAQLLQHPFVVDTFEGSSSLVKPLSSSIQKSAMDETLKPPSSADQTANPSSMQSSFAGQTSSTFDATNASQDLHDFSGTEHKFKHGLTI